MPTPKATRTPKALASNQTSLTSFFGQPTTSKRDESTHPSASAATSAQNRAAVKRPQPASNNGEAQSDVDDHDVEYVATTPSARGDTSAKRRRVVLSSSDEDDENVTPAQAPFSFTPRRGAPMSARRTPTSRGTASKQAGTPTRAKGAPVISDNTGTYIKSFQYNNASGPSEPVEFSQIKKKSSKGVEDTKEVVYENMEMAHLHYEFLKPEKIRDIKGNRPDHPDYDAKTLYVPRDWVKDQSEGLKQWWNLKAQFFDVILCFKIGKFYEMYHQDAVLAGLSTRVKLIAKKLIGIEQLGLSPMRGKYAHSGFPEHAYERFADRLLALGYKVARVEQTETPAMLEERNKKLKDKQKVVRRELCRVTTTATRTYGGISAYDDASNSSSVSHNSGPMSAATSFLMAIAERKNADGDPTKTSFGVCMLDCTVGQFYVCQFTDDRSMSTLRTLLAHNNSTQVLHERSLSQTSLAIITSILGAVSFEALVPKKEFLTAEETLQKLLDDNYLGGSVMSWPKSLARMVADPAEALPKPAEGYALGVSALGAIIFYLRKCLIDVDLISMRKFDIYTPATLYASQMKDLSSAERWTGRRMVLDGCALNSLHLLPPSDALVESRNEAAASDTQGQRLSLFATICRCSTPFGKRLLRQWVCAPLCDPKALRARQKAVEVLCSTEAKGLLEYATERLRVLPDLERLFQRIHSIGLKYRATEHPDARAQMFEMARYNGKKIKDLCATLDALDQVQKLLCYFSKHCTSLASCELLNECLGAEHTDMDADLKHFNTVIADRAKAMKDGRLLPLRGTDDVYERALQKVAACEAKLTAYMKTEQTHHRSNHITFVGKGKNRYQLEFPEAIAKNLGNKYELKSKRQGFQRFRTHEIEALVAELESAEGERDTILEDTTRRVFADFDERKNKWTKVLSGIATFDCLMSLACYACDSSLQMTMPEFDFESDEPMIDICAGSHPTLASHLDALSENATAYIPNDAQLGIGSKPQILLLSGANMAGKSTYMRQTAVLTVLAHIGSKVPAASMRLTPVDRIFCRIGASDCLAAGQSTFFIELNETNVVLREATNHSLVIIDELGRGTSTHDGTSIALAALEYIVATQNCRTLWSTHYHMLCKYFANNPKVALGHMACLVENDATEEPGMENITFLYTLASGACSGSYGLFCARMAGLSVDVVRRANEASRTVFAETNAVSKLRALRAGVRSQTLSDDVLMQEIQA